MLTMVSLSLTFVGHESQVVNSVTGPPSDLLDILVAFQREV